MKAHVFCTILLLFSLTVTNCWYAVLLRETPEETGKDRISTHFAYYIIFHRFIFLPTSATKLCNIIQLSLATKTDLCLPGTVLGTKDTSCARQSLPVLMEIFE